MKCRMQFQHCYLRRRFRALSAGVARSAATLMIVLAVAAMLPARPAHQFQAESDSSRYQAGTYSLLYSFQCGTDGANPQAGLVRDQAGNLYGTTTQGGASGLGTVFKVTPSGTETVLHSFVGAFLDGELPYLADLILDSAGNIYGVVEDGGQFFSGVVFKLTPSGTESVLYNFTDGTDGGQPRGALVRDNAGNLYGTTYNGGNLGQGVVFKLTPNGTETVLHSFENAPSDGALPAGGLARDPSGNLYGATYSGGAFGNGMVFEVTPGGVETTLYSFDGYPSDGASPYGGGLLRDATGNLYGVTTSGGATGDGVVFKLTRSHAETVLLNFNGGTGGGTPYDGLAEDAAGNLYGTTQYGGSSSGCGGGGCGVLFKLSKAGTETVLHNFAVSSADGTTPLGGVVRDPAGNLYGTLVTGGANSCGAVFKFTP